jgi:arylsulfatase A-like enzyme
VNVELPKPRENRGVIRIAFRLALLGAALASVLSCGGERPASAPVSARAEGPVIIISVDTLRADHLPVYGYSGVKTPAIDALAADSVVFENAYAHVPLTLPSHLSLLTGKLPPAHGVRNNLGYPFDAHRHQTLPSLLKGEGFDTAAIVSSYVLRASTGLGSAFDHYDDRTAATGGSSVDELQRAAPETLAAARRWIEAEARSRFFLLLHFYEPHAPYTPPEPFRSEYRGREYDGEIAAADASLGELIALLKQRNLYDTATIVFLSDHGEGLGDHGESQHGIFLYRESIRVPLTIKLPGSEKKGKRVKTPVGLVDLLPTIAQLAGATPPAGLSGESLLPIIEGREPARRIYAESMFPRIHLGLSDLAALIDGRHQYIEAPRPELYDLAADPQQKQNILADQRRVYAAMKKELDSIDRALQAPSAVSPEEAAKLAALGYRGAPAPANGALADPKDHIADLERVAELAHAPAAKSEEAIRELQAIVVRSPLFADAWSQLGIAFARAGRHEEAISAWRKTIELSPMLAGDTAISLAESYLQTGKIDECIAHAKLAAAAHPVAAHSLLANAYLARGDLALAEAEAHWLSSNAPQAAAGRLALAQVRLAQKRVDEAAAIVASLRHQGGGATPMLAFVEGDILARRGDLAAAEKAFLEETRSFPRFREAWVRAAAVQILQGKVREGERTLESMVRRNPDRASYLTAADALDRLGQPAAAARFRSRAR